MPWNIAQARQKFSEIIRRAADGPQLIYNRKRLVAAVIDAEKFRAFEAWSTRAAGRTLDEEFAELRQIMEEEDCELTVAPRSTRPSAFIETLKEERHELPR
ncbi:MAG: type II toxin-antitoxin system prevent-host-death family antitoxin [Gammaproteobacteria bacterium]|nr:type II toxin-antitoxin system prevent-host-death family antitoxin [Gammaproteobacteria bacterium]